MSPLSQEQTSRILSNPTFRELTAARARLRWGLSIVTLIMFFGFIGLISAASSTLGKNMAGGSIPLGMAVALGHDRRGRAPDWLLCAPFEQIF